MIAPFDLSGKTVLVTGASSGIGRQTAISIARQGGRLVITGRNPERLKLTYDQLPGQGHELIQADLTVPDSREQIISSSPELQGLVDCAGQIPLFPYKIYSEKRMRELFSVN